MFLYFLAVRLPSIKNGPSILSPKIPKHTVFVNVVNALQSSEDFHYSNNCSYVGLFHQRKSHFIQKKQYCFLKLSVSGNSVPHQIAKLYAMIKIV